MVFLGILLIALNVKAQDANLPVDFRQHNLTEYNSSLFSPVFSLDRNQPQSLAFWSRWQWQTVDGDPSTFFLNYTRGINRSMVGGIALIQHNTGIYLNTGGVLNYAFTTQIAPGFDLAAGLNVFGYQRKLADDSLLSNPNIDLPDPEDIDAFFLQLAPSIQFRYGPVSLGFVAENLLQYNFSSSRNEVNDNGDIFTGFIGAQIPLDLFSDWGSTYIQPTLYVKRLPGFDNQVGLTALLSTPKFWLQGGYNSFYGVSGGIGGRFFKNFSLGALIEYGTQGDLQDQDPTFELVTAFDIGPRWKPQIEEMAMQEEDINAKKEIAEVKKDSIIPKEPAKVANEPQLDSTLVQRSKRQKRLERKRKKDSLLAVQKKQAEQLAEELNQRRQDSIQMLQREKELVQAQKRQDSIRAIEEARRAAAQQRERDSLKALKKRKDSLEAIQKKTVTPLKGEKYEEVVDESGIAPGYYLIANVFRTKRYFDAFMKSLDERGLNPKSFYRESRKYNYVYLGKYSTIEEARQARDSQLNGRYKDDLWIFRMVVKK